MNGLIQADGDVCTMVLHGLEGGSCRGHHPSDACQGGAHRSFLDLHFHLQQGILLQPIHAHVCAWYSEWWQM